jgi:hypothetical protein
MSLNSLVIKTTEKHSVDKKNTSMEVVVALLLGKPTMAGQKKVFSSQIRGYGIE